MWWHTRLLVDCIWNVMRHAQKPDFVFHWNGRVHLNRQRRQFSRLLAAKVCASAVVMLHTPCSEVVWRVLATHSFRQFPPHFSSRASPCAITFQLDSTIHLLWSLNIPHLATRCIYMLFTILRTKRVPPLRVNLLFFITKTQCVYHGQICLYFLNEGQPLQPKHCRPTARLPTYTSDHIYGRYGLHF